jgi:hypothetical protein
VPSLNVENLDLPNNRVRRNGGGGDILHFQTGAARLCLGSSPAGLPDRYSLVAARCQPTARRTPISACTPEEAGCQSRRSSQRYVHPGPGAIAKLAADTDPAPITIG